MNFSVLPHLKNNTLNAATHNGVAHPDDVFSAALLDLVLAKTFTERCARDKIDDLEDTNLVFDMGKQMDLFRFPLMAIFDYKRVVVDHHHIKKHPNGCSISTSSFGWIVLWLTLNGVIPYSDDLYVLVRIIDLGDNALPELDENRNWMGYTYKTIRNLILNVEDRMIGDVQIGWFEEALFRAKQFLSDILLMTNRFDTICTNYYGVNKNINFNRGVQEPHFLTKLPGYKRTINASLVMERLNKKVFFDCWLTGQPNLDNNNLSNQDLMLQLVDFLQKEFKFYYFEYSKLEPEFHWKIEISPRLDYLGWSDFEKYAKQLEGGLNVGNIDFTQSFYLFLGKQWIDQQRSEWIGTYNGYLNYLSEINKVNPLKLTREFLNWCKEETQYYIPHEAIQRNWILEDQWRSTGIRIPPPFFMQRRRYSRRSAGDDASLLDDLDEEDTNNRLFGLPAKPKDDTPPNVDDQKHDN